MLWPLQLKKRGKKTSPISTSPGRQGPIFSGLRSPLHFPTAGAFNLVWPSCHLFFPFLFQGLHLPDAVTKSSSPSLPSKQTPSTSLPSFEVRVCRRT